MLVLVYIFVKPSYVFIFSDESIHSSSANLNIDKLKREIEDLRAALGNVELSHEMLQIQIKNCCKNDSFYAMTIQTHVDRMLQQVRFKSYLSFMRLLHMFCLLK